MVSLRKLKNSSFRADDTPSDATSPVFEMDERANSNEKQGVFNVGGGAGVEVEGVSLAMVRALG